MEHAAPSAMLSPEQSTQFRVRQTCLKMLRKRGYAVPDESLAMTPAQFGELFPSGSREELTIMVEKEDTEQGDQLFVFFPNDEKVGVKPIKEYISRMVAQKLQNAIIVVRQGLTPLAKQALSSLRGKGYKMEHFADSELLVDISEHVFVPQHILLTDAEKEELLNRYRLEPHQLPRIQARDPIARYYGLDHGQVVKIVRPSETAGRYVTYRICVNS